MFINFWYPALASAELDGPVRVRMLGLDFVLARDSQGRAMCLSDAGVYDLTGNVAEWVKRSFPHPNNYDYVVKGCYWSKCYMDNTPDCHFTNSAHPPGFRSYEFGFRCCMDKP